MLYLPIIYHRLQLTLLKQMYKLTIILLSLLALTIGQNYTAGVIKTATISNNKQATYPIQVQRYTQNIIISLSSFETMTTLTGCYISSKNDTKTNINCTGNVRSFYYLIFNKSPMVYSNIYSYYFYHLNKAMSAVWAAPVELTLYVNPKITGMITLIEQVDSLQSSVSLLPMSNAISLNITRSSNIRRVDFAFILLQQTYPYNLIFTTYDSEIKRTSPISASTFLMLGLQSLSINKQYNQETVFMMDPTSNNTYNISSNVLIAKAIIQIMPLALNCKDQYFNPYKNKCVETCRFPYKYSVGNYVQKYCLTAQNYTLGSLYSQSNLNKIIDFMPFGCHDAKLNSFSVVTCNVCLSNYSLLNQGCVCKYGTYMYNQKCLTCNQTCSPNLTFTASIPNDHPNSTKTVNLNIISSLPQTITIIQAPTSTIPIIVTLNNLQYKTMAFYSSANTVTFTVTNVPINKDYNVSIMANSMAMNSTFLMMNEQNRTFIWYLQSSQKSITFPISPQPTPKILSNVAPLFTKTETTVPLLFGISMLLGQKINAFSIFQTVSMLYMINFIKLDASLNNITTIIKTIFIFQPTPFIKLVHNNSFPKINCSLVTCNQMVRNYTQGSFYIESGFNNLIFVVLQIAVIVVAIKLLKRLLGPPGNQIYSEHQNQTMHISSAHLQRSQLDENGKIKWKNECQIKQQATLRQKIYLFICILDQKKYINFTSFIMMQLLSNTFLIFHEYTIPTYDHHSLLSKSIATIALTLILTFPCLLLTYEPLYLLKSAGIIYKRKVYNFRTIWLYFLAVYAENLMYPLALIVLNDSIHQLLCIIGISVFKLYLFRKVIKKLQFIKQIIIVTLFSALLFSFYLPSSITALLQQTIIGLILLIVCCQFFKLFRSMAIYLIGIFKQKKLKPATAKANKTVKQMVKIQKIQVNQVQRIQNPVFKTITRKRRRQNKQNLNSQIQNTEHKLQTTIKEGPRRKLFNDRN